MISTNQSLYGLQYCVIAAVCGIALLSLARVTRRMGDGSPALRDFRLAILFSALGAFMDIPFGLREFSGVDFPAIACYTSEMLYYASGVVSVFCWFFYSERIQNTWVICRKYCRFGFSCLLAVFLVLVATTPLHHLVFYFADGVYCRGILNTPIALLVLILAASSGVSALVLSAKKENYINRIRFRLLFFYAAGFFLIQLIQIIFGPVMPFRTLGATVVFMIITFRDIQQKVTVDALSRINNRFAMERYLSQKFAGGEPFRLMMLDLDDFKQINDKHGHVTGDKAIRLTASAVARSAPAGAFVCRYGGDEFCVIAPCTEEEMLRLEARIQENLADAAAAAKFPLPLFISAGCALKDDTVTTIPDLIEAADRQLYRKKALQKQKRKIS